MTTTIDTRHDTHPSPARRRPRRRHRPWLRVALTVFAVAWGGNEFTPLLVMYQRADGMSSQLVNILLGAYVLGIVPALLAGGPLADRWGRRPLMYPAPIFAIAGSTLLAFGSGTPALLFSGRVLSGLALGLAMAAGTSWIKELSTSPYDPSAETDSSAGARRASLALTAGFGAGAAIAAALAQFAPYWSTMPYLVNIAVTAVAGALLLGTPETRHPLGPESAAPIRLTVPSARHRRFLLVVVPMAPWVFGTATTAYAILPSLVMHRVPGAEVGLSGLLCVIALSCGFAIQSVARRIDTPHSARAVVIALALTAAGLGLTAVASAALTVWFAVGTAAVLGLAYGLLMLSGLQQVQRIASPDDLAGLTAMYYGLTYVGFFIPATLSALHAWVSYPTMFAAGAGLAALCGLWVSATSRTRLIRLHASR